MRYPSRARDAGKGRAPARPDVPVSRLLSAVLRCVFSAFPGQMALFGVLRRPTPVAQEPPLPAPAELGPTSCPARQNLPFYQREPLPAEGKNAGSDLKIPVDKKS
jgi:hypothetical protein